MHHAISRKSRSAVSRPYLRSANGPHGESLAARPNPLAAMQSAYGNQAVIRLLSSQSGGSIPAGIVQRTCSCGGAGPECAECKKKKHVENGLRRKAAAGGDSVTQVPHVVHEVLRSPGRPLEAGVRHFMEPRFGFDFRDVRIHTDAKAAASAEAVNAQAYTVGRNIVFGRNAYSTGAESRQLLAHELAHVVQQRGSKSAQAQTIASENDSYEREAENVAKHVEAGGSAHGTAQSGDARALRRTPAKKVSCAPGPLHLPDATVIADPVSVITAAENRANQLLDQAIAELDATRTRILGGATIGWPTVSDALAQGMRLIGLDANSARVWRERGSNSNYTAELLLRRLRLIRREIGSGSFFFTCLGPQNGTLGPCAGAICQGADASTCPGAFQTAFCIGFWESNLEYQAARIIHETSHNFALFISDPNTRGSGTAECYARFAQVVGGVNIGGQRTDLCP
ncbi:MAG: DUF4157 domain-containing protein, partial [Terracidiphilus sp.]